MIRTEKSPAQKRRAYLLFGTFAAAFITVLVYLFVSLRPLLLPAVIGGLAAFISKPILDFLTKKHGMHRELGIFLILGLFIGIIAVVIYVVQSALPDERDKLLLRTRIQYKINERFVSFMGIDSTGEGNILYNFAGKDLAKALVSVNAKLTLSPHERDLFLSYAKGSGHNPPFDEKFMGYFQVNIANDQKRLAAPVSGDPEARSVPSEEEGQDAGESKIQLLAHVIETWILMPFVFLFLLADNGQIKRYLVGFVPNKYFEVTLIVMDKANDAIGNYLRGITLECSLVGLTFVFFLWIIGFEIKWAIIVGAIAGITTAIPIVGTIIGFIAGSGYAFLAEESCSFIPFFTANNLIIGVVLTVIIAHLLDNAVFQPIVLGGAVSLHPLVVITAIFGASLLFGPIGMLFAVPTIAILKVFFSTLFKELKAYSII
ncbi:MAG: hypothetical protein A2268_00720 [Candidatus Raymondbacteria bacterium RifOxyA12_full_50_37]|uniref:AI-2E family transporter n=1 Tax=Candidatus Raymondbacteria bacterium RIFOXYD12_FULL_49_13 TaxID=1817890 RepID=A0A1F7FAE3_UNCRA|nr:MAG: hypothetical protein A2268_00720 [Candidatus Raymondbacteria bacterium RifOxyA12_full_50_37]OGJ90052.1 MAG: hypothetical protein A2248_19050 [Candidatus Raymondbacteria bacterium RIFOXYA2_FULL_49_16]OGJ96692.1 MAG: hypothetical protein A2350_01900 [Candidatus Raymondbacteria bacterium RifOxyB12_full_50_8]OGJ96736.1 MAG: hypothetical protein A2453_06175 [Candidatus Raymondbacteria bacterium RIFOXYC2_FULL_50_21]OGK03487.1 MAG: hypothetical protein A2519_15750 [Candidatus Raymondbacteria b